MLALGVVSGACSACCGEEHTTPLERTHSEPQASGAIGVRAKGAIRASIFQKNYEKYHCIHPRTSKLQEPSVKRYDDENTCITTETQNGYHCGAS